MVRFYQGIPKPGDLGWDVDDENPHIVLQSLADFARRGGAVLLVTHEDLCSPAHRANSQSGMVPGISLRGRIFSC